jgi:hypothetical protein
MIRLLTLFVFTCFFSCAIDESLLIGKWHATAYYENGQRADAPLDSIVLVFDAQNQYRYQTIGQYREAGTYRTDMKYLFLKDSTGNASSEERLMRILYLSKDSLKLLMGAEGKDLVLFLGRKE